MNKLMVAGGIAAMGLTLCAATNETEVVTATNSVAAVRQSSQDDADAAKRAADRARIEELLKRSGLAYEVEDGGGSYGLELDVGGGRTQVLRVYGKIEGSDDYEVVTLCSVAYRGVLTKPMMRDLLTDDNVIGHWYARPLKDGYYEVHFDAKVPTDVSGDCFSTLCDAVVTIADRLEKKWTDSDRF